MGGAAGWLATFLTILGANWAVLLSAVVAWGVTSQKAAFAFAADPHVHLFGSVFLWSLWTYLALSILYRLHNGISTQPKIDYAFGVIIEGVGLAVDQGDDGNFQPNLAFRNLATGPIKIQVKECRVVIGGRTNPDQDMAPLVMPRFGTKGLTAGLFKKSDFPNSMYEGTFSLILEYGPYDGEAVRRLRWRGKLVIRPTAAAWGFANEHISEEDTAI
jgi:hypothetical protein